MSYRDHSLSLITPSTHTHTQTIGWMLKTDTLSVSSHWNFVTNAVLMDGQRKDATHSTIWLMPRPLLMNYAKLCPRERSHMFIMKAAGVLKIPWVAPNELHVTGRRDTQHGAVKGGGRKKKKTQPSPELIGCIHQATLGEFWRCWFSVVSTMIDCSVRAEYVCLGCLVSHAVSQSSSRSHCRQSEIKRNCADGCQRQRRVTPAPELKHGSHFVAKRLQLQPVYPNHH